jgi:pimeloyl-ACP methyl ester carboxylesterase
MTRRPSGLWVLVLALAAAVAGTGCGGGESTSARPWDEQDVAFTSASTRLFGVLALPMREGPHPAVVLLTGSGRGGVDTPLLRLHARRLASDGFAVLRYDPPGVGRSEGEGGFQTLQHRAREAVAAADFLRAQRGIAADEVGLWGESQGGWVTQMAAAASPKIAFIVSVSGSGVPVTEQQVYSVEAQSRAVGFSADEIAKASLFARLLIDGQLTDDLYRERNEADALRLGPGPWRRFAALVYAEEPLTAADSLSRTIALLRSIQTEPWARYLYLDTAYLPALEAVPPAGAEAARRAAEESLLVDPKLFLTRVHVPVLAFFGEDDTLVPARRSATIYRRYLRQAGNDDATIVVFPDAGHSVDDFGPTYWDTVVEWLQRVTGE